MSTAEEECLPDALRADRAPFVCKQIYDAADWYDVDYAAYRGEVAFYRLMIERHLQGRDLVELGAGTGRLSLPLRQVMDAGCVLHAVEPSQQMRQRLLSKRDQAKIDHRQLKVEDGIAGSFVGPSQPIGLVIFAFNGLLHLTTRTELSESFRHIFERLDDDGAFAFDLTPPYWQTMLRGRVPWGRIDERVHPGSGRVFLTCDRSRYEPATRTTHIDIRYAYRDALEGDVGVQIALCQHMWTCPEILQATVDAGFVIDSCFGDVDLSAFTEGSPRLLVGATKGSTSM